MRSVSLLFKVLWSPGEAMFLLSKTPRVVAPLVFLSLMSLLTGAATVMKLDTADMTMRAI
jgi:predicted Abi (CAAX) family protease